MAQEAQGNEDTAVLTGATTVQQETSATPDQVWAILANGWTYGSWVVGASRVRSVDEMWPAAGAVLHHSVGVWPLLRDDVSSVIEAEPARRLVLAAQVKPAGTQTVELTIAAHGEGSIVSMREDGTSGPVRWVPRPVRQVSFSVRNREALLRLCLLAEGMSGPEGA